VEKLFTLSRFVKSDTSELTHAEFRIMCGICSHCNKDDLVAFPSQQRLADMAGMDRTNVRKRIKTLVEKGFLKYLPKVGKSNRYMVLIKGEEDERKRGTAPTSSKNNNKTSERNGGSIRKRNSSAIQSKEEYVRGLSPWGAS